MMARLRQSGIVRALRRWIYRIAYFGRARYCACCGSHSRSFMRFGLVPRPDARCPFCDSLERHRLLCIFLERKTDLFDGRAKRLLHVAPEAQMARLFRRAPNLEYLSADLEPGRAMIAMDLTDIELPDASFDVIFCSHVLEHVHDDRKALRELHRVLRPGGWAILQVPIVGEVTFQDDSITDPKQREEIFGQSDHIRNYGRDYAERLAEAGFAVRVDGLARELGAAECERLGVMPHEDIYFCRKDSGAA